MNGFRIEKKRGRNGTCRIQLSGRFGDKAAFDLEDQLAELLEDESTDATVSFRDVLALSRENLGVLLSMASSFDACGGKLKFIDLPPRSEAELRILAGERYFNRVSGE